MKLILRFVLLLLVAGFAYGEEGGAGAGLMLGGMDELEGVSYSGGKLSAFTVTGTGIVTARPDNVYISLQIKSSPGVSMKSAEADIERKIDFMQRGICREFKIKKDSFKIIDGDNETKETTTTSIVDPNVEKKSYTQSVSKTVVINELGGKKRKEIIEIIDAAVKYGAVAIPAAGDMPADSASSSATLVGKKGRKTSAKKGASKLKIKEDIKETSNQLINSHFSEESMKKLLKQAKDLAFKEIKDKIAKVKAKVKINEAEYDFNIKEENTVSSTEDGDVNIKADVSVEYTKTAPKQE